MSEVANQPTREYLAFQNALAGRYSLEREVGRGGMGTVFLAREVALDRRVALKLLPPEMAARPGVRERFLQEARTAARLSHPNIVPIYTVDEVEGFVFFAMAYVAGGTLADRVRSRGPLSNSEAVGLLRDVAWALGYAHLQGIVHRDVKPDNILLDGESGRALVADFGIAVAAEKAGQTSPTEVMGTAEFMSPEQARGGEVDARADLYSLGCVGFYALTGRAPFEGETPAEILGHHLSEPAPQLASVAPEVPPGVATALDRCLRKDPDHRFAHGEALAEALSPSVQLDRELPVPLRVFVKQARGSESTLAWCLLGEIFFLPSFLAAVLSEPSPSALALGLVVVVLAGFPVATLFRYARQLLRAGYTVHDGVGALLQDVERKNEEFRFQVGQRVTWVDQVIRWVKRGGFLGAGLSLAAGWLSGFSPLLVTVFPWSLVAGFAGSLLLEVRSRARGDVMGERWLRLWRSGIGRGIFKLGGIKLDRVAPAVSGVYRPTEVAIGLAADRLFEELPREVRRGLAGLPETVRALEDDAQVMRKQVVELDGVLAEIGDDDPARPGAVDRARVRRGVEATRAAAREKLQEAVAALEKVRLGLLYLHAGTGTVKSMTVELEAARDLSAAMGNLLEGHREVERLLEERRRTGVLTLPGSEESEPPPE